MSSLYKWFANKYLSVLLLLGFIRIVNLFAVFMNSLQYKIAQTCHQMHSYNIMAIAKVSFYLNGSSPACLTAPAASR